MTTPTPALYMDNFSDAAKGKVKAAEREAEKDKKEKDNKKNKRSCAQKLSPPAATPTAGGLRWPSDAAPQRACALAAARLRAVAEGRPAWALATVRLRAAAARLCALAEGHQGHGAAGTPRWQGGAHFCGLRWRVQRGH